MKYEHIETAKVECQTQSLEEIMVILVLMRYIPPVNTKNSGTNNMLWQGWRFLYFIGVAVAIGALRDDERGPRASSE